MCFAYKNHPPEHLFLVLERPYLGQSTSPLLQSTFSSFDTMRQSDSSTHSMFSEFASHTPEMSMDVQPPSSFGPFCLSK